MTDIPNINQQAEVFDGNTVFDDVWIQNELHYDFTKSGTISVSDLNVIGVSTFSSDVTFGGDITLDEITCRNANVTGIATVGTGLYLTGKLFDGDGDFGTSGQLLASDGTDTVWIDASSTSVANANNVGVNANSTNADQFITFVETTSGNNPIRVDTGLKYNPHSNTLKPERIEFADDDQLRFGNGNDLKISHTDSLSGQNDSNGDSVLAGTTYASFINETGTGPLVFKTDGGPSTGAFQFYDTGWRPILKLFSGSSARAALYHSGAEKLVTSSTGVTVTGTVNATNFTGNGSQLTNIQAGQIVGNSIFVQGMIILWSGAANAIPTGFVLCDGNNSTPDLRDRFVVGAGSAYSVGDNGGANSVTLTVNQIPSHTHSYVGHTYPGSGPEQNQSGGPEDRTSFNVNKTTGSTGSGQSHENRPPYYALCYIMKT